MFEGEQFTRTGKAGLNFVDNQQNAVFLSDLANALQPFDRSRVHAAFTLNRFQDDCRRFAHAAFDVINQVFKIVSQCFNAGFAADTQRAAVLMRVRHKLDFRHHAVNRFFR
ncbi:hypothetical protein D3C78_1527000 [compost metagenome]